MLGFVAFGSLTLDSEPEPCVRLSKEMTTSPEEGLWAALLGSTPSSRRNLSSLSLGPSGVMKPRDLVHEAQGRRPGGLALSLGAVASRLLFQTDLVTEGRLALGQPTTAHVRVPPFLERQGTHQATLLNNLSVKVKGDNHSKPSHSHK